MRCASTRGAWARELAGPGAHGPTFKRPAGLACPLSKGGMGWTRRCTLGPPAPCAQKNYFLARFAEAQRELRILLGEHEALRRQFGGLQQHHELQTQRYMQHVACQSRPPGLPTTASSAVRARHGLDCRPHPRAMSQPRPAGLHACHPQASPRHLPGPLSRAASASGSSSSAPNTPRGATPQASAGPAVQEQAPSAAASIRALQVRCFACSLAVPAGGKKLCRARPFSCGVATCARRRSWRVPRSGCSAGTQSWQPRSSSWAPCSRWVEVTCTVQGLLRAAAQGQRARTPLPLLGTGVDA